MASMTRVSSWTIIAYVAFHELERGLVDVMASQQEREELDHRVSKDETVIPSETGGKSLEAQGNLALGRIRGGETMMEQLGHEGYQEIGHKGDLSTGEESGQEHAEQEGGVQNDESKSKS